MSKHPLGVKKPKEKVETTSEVTLEDSTEE